MDLFEDTARPEGHHGRTPHAPLAERLRPLTLDDIVGQKHLLGPGKPLRVFIERDEVPSMIFWGPPGCGKTTIARVIAHHSRAEYFQLNAVASGVQEVRKVLERASVNRKKLSKKTILFIDEIHRFNKAQQYALLHAVEEGDIILIGATTENPSFEVITPLLSRCFVYVLAPLEKQDLTELIKRALGHDPAIKKLEPVIGEPERDLLIQLSGGDARILLNGLETALALLPQGGASHRITAESLTESFQRNAVRYDKAGEEHYNIISAFIKSIRGSDPDAAVYWMARMLEGGEDPKFLARRMIVLASEDVGNADPAALPLAVACFTAVDYIGMPEARIVLSQTAVYLASAPKSNASYRAIDAALGDVRNGKRDPVPIHLRNAPTQLMKDLRYGLEYKYSHEYDGHFVEQQYLPESLLHTIYYRPTNEGAEKTIRERLNRLWKSKPR
jgi:putative ATPase